MLKKKAFITGIAGQDGSYLAPFLLDKGYEVHGLIRSLTRKGEGVIDPRVHLHEGEMTDTGRMKQILEQIVPDEIYNLAAQSSVAASFVSPELTWQVNYHAFGNLVREALHINPNVRIYQASTSEMFGNSPAPQHEETVFNPQSPYAESKVKAHTDFVVGIRNATGAFAVSGFLFNHESPKRGKNYVTRKITHTLARIAAGLEEYVELGNLNAVRDWGHAQDYVRAMHMMLQQEQPEDFVIASGASRSVRDFVETAARHLNMEIIWEGEGVNEVGRNKNTGRIVVKVNPEFYRPQEVNYIQGDVTKARTKFGWEPRYTFNDLVKEMVDFDRRLIINEHKIH